ncbi:DEAD/DEAH box helicase [Pseudonocardia abyssalis]|uniref:DEAD/DEAH box helicase n=1 Tax=Pseudonocardia abyssalis TaxID=2792008 RepID=A0ABS6UPC7_9PSEU|nr:DEAD/DEAH box helicase [Pseudonocardia abyssalis]MBW0117636.1 DEAD/DEAH box helicase [Pseudonocardia abyssalis]MBW0134106.1 DEAD/DEAH box helicase [Pseudonocardia abyssalis]
MREASFLPADPPRTGTLVLWGDPPAPTGSLGIAGGPGGVVRPEPVRLVEIGDALPLLLAADDTAAGSVLFWAAAARTALGLVARGRLLPGVTAGGWDAWRAGPLDAADADRLRALAAAMPAQARAVPADGTLLPAAAPLVRAFVDAVADHLPRSGDGPYAGTAPVAVPELRDWAAEAAAGVDAGVRVSLRLDGLRLDGDPAGRLRLVVQVHALHDPTRLADLADVWSGAAVGFGPDARVDALRAVRRAARFWAPLEQLLTRTVPDEADLDDVDLADLLDSGGAALAEAGISVHRPRDLTSLQTQVVAGGAGRGPSLLGTDPFRLDWEVALGGTPLTPDERDELARSHRPVVRLRGEWVLVDSATRRRAANPVAPPVPVAAALGAALTGEIDLDGTRVAVRATGRLAELREKLTAAPEPDAAPDGLTAVLRDYQLRGVGWLHRMTSLGLGACLADDMGLGKTVTLIALHLRRAALGTGATLVVCPASLLGNWEREIGRFAPGLAVARYHGPDRALGAADVVLTTYATMRLDAEVLAAHGWGLVVADEAQHVKNAGSGTARALRTIPSPARVALTGTPVENDLDELWAILDWATPGLLGTRAGFRRRWSDPIASGDTDAAARFARLIGPFLLRRRKSDPGIAPELPRKTETDRPVALTPEQAGLYAAVVDDTLARIAAADGTARRGLVLGLLTALKQVCNHPAQYAHEAEPVLAGRSGKVELLDELLDTILAEGGSVLVFTQYVAMARLLERHLADRGIGHALLHGGTPVPRREELVDAFQRGETPVFLLSLKAAGTGLNLTRADHVVHYDRWWNPAVEDQATDRAYRIGQTRPVQVHRLITEGTLEDRIATLLETKRALADAVLTGGEAALSELSDADLAELVGLR